MATTYTQGSDNRDDRLAFLEDTFDSYLDGIAIIDAYGTFVLGNARYCEMFFDPGAAPTPGESAIQVVRRIVEGGQVFGLDQMDPEQAVLNCLIDCFSFVQGAEFGLKDGRVIQVSSTPTKMGGHLMTFRDTGRDRLGERRAAELLSEGFGSADMGMVLWDAGLAVQLVNAAWQELSTSLQIGDDITAFFVRLAEEGKLAVPKGQSPQAYVRECLTDMHSKPMQITLDMPDNRVVQVSTFGITSGGVMATAVDVTAQRDTEERARALLHDAVDALAIGVMHFDADLKLLMMNDAARRMVLSGCAQPALGTGLGDIVADLIDAGEILVPPTMSRAELITDFVDSARRFRTGQRPAWRGDRTLEFSADPTKLGGVLVSVRDLTEAVKADRAAREANELVKTILDASPSTFLVSKMQTGEIVLATQAFRERFGEVERTHALFVDPVRREAFQSQLVSAGTLTDYPVQFRRQDGTFMDGLTSARIIEYQGEQMVVSSTSDITDYLSMQRELEVQRTHALQNEKLSALGELLAGVAHELSNPLSVVVGYAMMLRDDAPADPARQKLDRIAIAADRCVRIVKMFLALARDKPALLETCDIGTLIESALAVSDEGLVASGGQVRVDIPADLPRVQVDPDHITQVFSNLIVNAGHAVRDLGQMGQVAISARLESGGTQIAIDVQDNGPGVPNDIHHRVFEPFFTTKDVGHGTGFGLAFSQRVISAHGGSLALARHDGQGALFRILLPVSPVAAARAAPHEQTIVGEAGQRRTMVLDDDPNVGRLLSDVLGRAGYVVDVFADGLEALRQCDNQAYDVIVSDMRMPGMDGEGFFRALSLADPAQAARVIFLTGDTMNTGVAAFLQQCGQPYLEKPVTPDDLMVQIRVLSSKGT